MHAIGIRIIRTYNLQYPKAHNVLKAIKELKADHTGFEMYVMLGAWIDCKNAWTDFPVDHFVEDFENNSSEISKAVKMANMYPDIVKIISVGNEAMVHWATSYFVQPNVILKWVNHLQELKQNQQLPKNVWITSSDNFASWGGGSPDYHNRDLEELLRAVDYVSIHTYPFHDTHYNPEFWLSPNQDNTLSQEERIERAMNRAVAYAIDQFNGVKSYMQSLGIDKPIHIGETGWATTSQGLYGPNGSLAADEYKQALYYNKMRQWTNDNKISCFFFEAFDEPWKDHLNPNGSENHFGLFTVDGKAKFALWSKVDDGVFKALSRDNLSVIKTFNGNQQALMEYVFLPKTKLIPKLN
jgi:exo-beta-1,3-glucanase (GH17 family)